MTQSPRSWDDLRFFLHIGRTGSLTSAADKLGVSHATVFRRLGSLEAELGVRLFARSRAGYALTEAGKELLQVAADMETELASATRQLGKRAAWPGGVVRLTTTDTLMHAALAPLLSAYQRQANVQLLINTSTVQQDILKGEADVAIRAGGRPADPLVARRLCRIESTVYRSRKIGGVTPGNLADFPWVAGDETFAHLDSSKWLHQHGLDSNAVLRTNSHIICVEPGQSRRRPGGAALLSRRPGAGYLPRDSNAAQGVAQRPVAAHPCGTSPCAPHQATV